MTKLSELYDRDFMLWTEEQAAALRRARDSNLPLDWDDLAEEIESLGISQRTQLNSQIRRILRNLFKLDASPAADPRAGWRTTIRDARTDIEDLFEASPSLRRAIAGVLKKQHAVAAKLASGDLAELSEDIGAIRARMVRGGFTAEQVLGDWFPEPPPEPQGEPE